MKKTSILLGSIFIFLLLLSGRKTVSPYQKDTVPEKVAALYAANFQKFQNEVDSLAALANTATSIELGWSIRRSSLFLIITRPTIMVLILMEHLCPR